MSAIFDPHIHPQSIALVGVGGTGASLARIVGRILYDLQRAKRHTPRLVLIDPDRIEPHNVGRQGFSPALVGKYKAECVARMLNMALGLDVHWIPDAVEARHFDRHGEALVLSCVDNHLARATLHELRGLAISAGNHHTSAQVVIGNTTDAALMRRFIDGQDGVYRYLPREGLLFPSLLQPEPAPVPPPSCAEDTASGTQHLLVNDWVANVMGGYLYKLLHRQPIRSFLTFLDAETGVVQPKPISRAELEVYLSA